MSFTTTIEKYTDFEFEKFFDRVRPDDVTAAMEKEKPGVLDFLTMLSPRAAEFLEPMARRAQQLTVQHFGRTIHLFIPLYISNYCSNQCVYCGFNCTHAITRRKLDLKEIEAEARAIAATGMQHLLLLTGESVEMTPIDYLEAAVSLLKSYFASVGVEMFPMQVDAYQRLRAAGADSLTLYQEVYDRQIYRRLHLAGRKTDYRFRLDAPERGAWAGFRAINIGPLIGLGEPRREVFFAGLHARYLDDHFLDTEVGLSLPRLNPAEGDFRPEYRADDRTFVQLLLALRLFMPRAALTVSTRERADFRNHLIRLGITRLSAGSCTGVGGYARPVGEKTPQFVVSDTRSVQQVAEAIAAQGYQPVYKDWDLIA
ncbi:MAG: 2-iminoacetate synthase ThiH [Desulfatitalea sp.]|nr:2-iminoacetate synthase ThiH [Desulfatitalea sp.]NNK02228.1 2-iminoacetate synthase ThiH [Desulfatitalea sp.]